MHAKQKANEIGYEYNFDVTKNDEIFDKIFSGGQLKLVRDHKLPFLKEIAGKQYYKWHKSSSHAINSCVIFRNQIRQAFEKKRLKFQERKMKVGTDPFLKITNNMVSFQWLLGNGSTHKRDQRRLKVKVDIQYTDSSLKVRYKVVYAYLKCYSDFVDKLFRFFRQPNTFKPLTINDTNSHDYKPKSVRSKVHDPLGVVDRKKLNKDLEKKDTKIIKDIIEIGLEVR